MDNGKKDATRILTTNDIRENARNWTLAGDVGLLAHLEQFSENIINRTQETQKHFTDLVDDYEELYTKVGNVTNQFLALQNCQFVENRVYDEETPTEEKAEVKVKNEVEQEKLLLMQYKEAVEVGIKLLDTHFQEVQLPPNSDSDDDDDDDEVSNGNSVIWKPKNPYADKKFPLLIGSAEWWADDHVGLGTEEDVLETEKISSDSETDMESLKSLEKETKSSSSSMENIKSIPTKPVFLSSSSEDIFGVEKSGNLKSSVSDDFIFKRRESFPEQTEDFLPDFDKETEKMNSSGEDRPLAPDDDGEEKLSAAVNPKKVDNAFTRELMAKLSSVTTKKESGVKEIEKKKEKEKEEKANKDEDLFDEADDGSDLFSAKVVQYREEGRKEGGSLFFETENDDDLFKGEKDLFSGRSLFESVKPKGPKSPSVAADVSEAPMESQKSLKLPKTPDNDNPGSLITIKNSTKALFDDLDDDDTLFTAGPPDDVTSNKSSDKLSSKSFYSPETNVILKKTQSDITTGLVWNSDDALFGNTNTRSSFSAAAEDDLLSSSALFDFCEDLKAKISTESRSKKSDADLFPEEPPKEVKKENFEEFDAKVSSEKELSKDSFGFSPAKKIGVLDSEDDDDDLFSKGPGDKRPSLKSTAFAADDDDAALFGEPPKLSDAVSMSSSRSSLFDDLSISKSRLASVFEKDKGSAGSGEKAEEDLFSVSEDSLFGGEKRGGSLGKEKTKGEKEKTSLFGECDDDDDLFGGERSTGVKVQEVKMSVKAFVDDAEDDLFKASGGPTKLRETKSDTFKKSEHKLFVDDEDAADLFSTTKPKPPSTLRLKGTESEAKGKTVGKLNIPDNLKVRFESAAQRISPGAPRPSAAEEEEEKEDRKEKEVAGEEEKKNDVLDEPPLSSNLLKCPSKDRVKIPGRRRPQSRRARQEALRASGTWDQLTSTPAQTSAPLSNPLSPSTDEEDFFKVPELDTNFEKEDQSIFKNDLFESSKSSKPEEGLLFDGAPVLSPLGSRKKGEKPKVSSIFDDDDDLNPDNDDDSLFKSSKRLPPKREERKEKKSLFEEETDDEDDLFGGKSASMAATVTASAKPSPKKLQDDKDKDKQKESLTFLDPLGLIKKD